MKVMNHLALCAGWFKTVNVTTKWQYRQEFVKNRELLLLMILFR